MKERGRRGGERRKRGEYVVRKTVRLQKHFSPGSYLLSQSNHLSEEKGERGRGGKGGVCGEKDR